MCTPVIKTVGAEGTGIALRNTHDSIHQKMYECCLQPGSDLAL